MFKWINKQMQSPKCAMYPCSSAFFSYVSQEIDSAHGEIPESDIYKRPCAILPYDITDRSPT
ncbi:hypothetical protein IW140_006642, partial [Coemansia sp. RSA 1813]